MELDLIIGLNTLQNRFDKFWYETNISCVHAKIGIPIKDIQVKIENRQLTTQDMPLELLNKVQMLTGMGSLQTIEVKFVYKDYILNINEESQGTQKLLNCYVRL